MRRRFETSLKMYEYQIVSNCIGGGIIIDDEIVGTVPQSGVFTFLSIKQRLGSISIQGGVPYNTKETISEQTESTRELVEKDDIKLIINIEITPSLGFSILLYLPNQFTVREQEKKYVTYREILYTAPDKKYNVKNYNHIVMNYTSEQHEYSADTIIGDPVYKVYETGSDTSWSCELVETNIKPKPSPTSFQHLTLRSAARPRITGLGKGTFYATYSAHIKLELYSKAHGSISEYVVTSKTVTFDNTILSSICRIAYNFLK